MPAQAGQGMISGKSKQPHNHLVVIVKNSSIKDCFYICGTTITQFSIREDWRASWSNKEINYSKQKWWQSLYLHTVHITYFWNMNYLSCSLCPASIKRTVCLQESRASTFSHWKNTFVLAAIQPCSGFTLDRTSPCSLGAVLRFRKIWVHYTSQNILNHPNRCRTSSQVF